MPTIVEQILFWGGCQVLHSSSDTSIQDVYSELYAANGRTSGSGSETLMQLSHALFVHRRNRDGHANHYQVSRARLAGSC